MSLLNTHTVIWTHGKCPVITVLRTTEQPWTGFSASLPEFLLRQVELHEFVFLVLLVQSGDDCFRLLVAWLFHKRLNVLLENADKMWSITDSTWCPNVSQDGSIKHFSRFYISFPTSLLKLFAICLYQYKVIHLPSRPSCCTVEKTINRICGASSNKNLLVLMMRLDRFFSGGSEIISNIRANSWQAGMEGCSPALMRNDQWKKRQQSSSKSKQPQLARKGSPIHTRRSLEEWMTKTRDKQHRDMAVSINGREQPPSRHGERPSSPASLAN